MQKSYLFFLLLLCLFGLSCEKKEQMMPSQDCISLSYTADTHSIIGGQTISLTLTAQNTCKDKHRSPESCARVVIEHFDENSSRYEEIGNKEITIPVLSNGEIYTQEMPITLNQPGQYRIMFDFC